MEILVAVLATALLAAVLSVALRRRSAGDRGLGSPRTSPLGRRNRGARRGDPMAVAVAEHARAMDPQDVVIAERRLRAQAREVAAGMQSAAQRSEQQRAADRVADGAAYAVEPQIDAGAQIATDPRYDDPRYDGRLAADYVDPRLDDRNR